MRGLSNNSSVRGAGRLSCRNWRREGIKAENGHTQAGQCGPDHREDTADKAQESTLALVGSLACTEGVAAWGPGLRETNSRLWEWAGR